MDHTWESFGDKRLVVDRDVALLSEYISFP